MTADDLARAVAKDMGPVAEKSTEAAISGEGTRGWKEATEIGFLILEASKVAWEVYKHTQLKTEIEKEVLENTPRPSGITEAQRKSVVDAIVKRMGSGAP